MAAKFQAAPVEGWCEDKVMFFPVKLHFIREVLRAQNLVTMAQMLNQKALAHPNRTAKYAITNHGNRANGNNSSSNFKFNDFRAKSP